MNFLFIFYNLIIFIIIDSIFLFLFSAVLPGQEVLLPLRRAGHLSFRLEQLQEDLVRQPGQALALVLLSQRLAPAAQHLAPSQPQPAVLRRAADGHLGALAGASPGAGPRIRTDPATRPRRQNALFLFIYFYLPISIYRYLYLTIYISLLAYIYLLISIHLLKKHKLLK